MSPHDLPPLNAALNGTAALFLLAGWFAIKRRNPRAHMWLMIGAVALSAAFLASYLTYHFTVQGVTRYRSDGFDRTFYLLVLLTHTVLAAVVAGLVPVALWFAYRRRFDRHARVTRWLWPTWMYVSVTGVLIYLMLYVYPGAGVRVEEEAGEAGASESAAVTIFEVNPRLSPAGNVHEIT